MPLINLVRTSFSEIDNCMHDNRGNEILGASGDFRE